MASDSYDPKSRRPGEQAAQKGQSPAAGGGAEGPHAAAPTTPPQVAQMVLLQQQPTRWIDTGTMLGMKPRLTVAFPPCGNELLALVREGDGDEVSRIFREYFRFLRHRVLGQSVGPPAPKELSEDLPNVLDRSLLNCPESGPVILMSGGGGPGGWPTDCCICSPCVTLDGNRNRLPQLPQGTPVSPVPPSGGPVDPQIRRLFIGDLLWLFYFDRMGIFQIVGALLDAYASSGRLPISNGSIDPGVKDDVVALVLETMVRQTKMGMATGVRDRGAAFRTCLGWVTEGARKLNLDTVVNTELNKHFHSFMYGALTYYKDRSLATAIRGAIGSPGTSVATLITVSDTIDVMKKRFEPFAYGRNYYNTLSGIVWAVAGMSLIRELRATLGIAPAYGDAHEFIPAAYDLLVMKRPVTYGEMNRYDLHRTCAENGRDILLDLEVLDHQDRSQFGTLESWLIQIESKVEAYRTAYRTLTGVDLATTPTPAVEQAA